MKAIKHIKAGLLHIEVIGKVPERPPGRRTRAGRSAKTCPAQQFYNDKCSWRELMLQLAANFAGRDLVLVLTYNEEHLPRDKAAGDKEFQKFVRRLRRVRKRRGQELRYVYNTEGFHGLGGDPVFGPDGELEDRRIHHHVVLNRAGPDDLEEIRSLWHGGGYVRAEPLDIHYYKELARYLTKEAREFGRPRPGQRTWKASRNLRPPEVEYIEIPSDSVTLSPPFGAVDYEPFVEKNPWGFADCIGAKYLLFPEPERRAYSYTRPRERKRNASNNF